jgi:hypothetical protein
LVAPASGGKPADRERPLRSGVDLAIRAIQRSHQKHTALQAPGISNRGNGHIHLGSGPRERWQASGDKYGRHILDDRRRRGNLRSHALHDVGQGLSGEDGLLAVAGLREPHHHAIANQRILAHSFDVREIANLDHNRIAGKYFTRCDQNKN